jgi:AraC-like DNA-binding protein
MADHAEMLIRPDLPGVEVLRAHFQAYRYSRHAHEHAVIGLVDEGVQSYAYRGARHVTGATGLFFVNAGEAHTGEPGDEHGYTYRSLCLDEAQLSRLFGDLGFHRLHFREPVVYHSELHHRLLILHRALEAGGSLLQCEETLMGFLEALSAFNTEEGGGATLRTYAADRPAVQMIRSLIHDDPAGNHSLAELGRLVNMSPYHLAHVFAAEVGAPIFVYAEAVRMGMARRMLKSEVAIVEIALNLGFSDQSHFTRRFKEHEGVTPGQYRRAARPVSARALERAASCQTNGLS